LYDSEKKHLIIVTFYSVPEVHIFLLNSVPLALVNECPREAVPALSL